MSLTEYSTTFKPFKYPWAMITTEQHEKIHWGSWEAKLQDDVNQWKGGKLTAEEKDFITQILRIFTQSDVAVGGNYCDLFISSFRNNEIRNMLLSFANREGTHQRAYALLNDTLGLPEKEYSAFLEFQAMRDKIEFMTNAPEGLGKATHLAFELARSVCNEGMSLFSAFVMLLNFQRFGKMKGMCEIVEWSIRDETCFTPDTEILTEIGWVSFEELPRQIKVAQYNSSSGEISFVEPQSYIDKQYDGELVSFKSTYKFDLTATADHDLLYLHSYSSGLTPKKVRFDEFEPHYRKKIIVSGRKVGGRDTLTALDKFRIALQADGSIDYRINGKFSGCRVSTFSLKKERKIQRLLEILDSLGWEYTKSSVSAKGMTSIRVKSPAQIELSKTFSWVDLDGVSSHWAEDFLYELGHWDGHFVEGREERVTYVTTEKFNLDVVQAISILAGWACTIGVRVDDRKESFKDCHVANLHADTTFRATGNVDKTSTRYKGRVMCVSVPNGNIVVRQNGRSAIVGNCHVEGMTKLFQEYCKEHPRVVTDKLKSYIYTNYEKAVELEDALVDLIFGGVQLEGLTPDEVKTYVRYLADRRLLQLGLKPIFGQKTNPLKWLDWVVSGDDHSNFFESVVTQYSADGLVGEWDWSNISA